MTTVERIAQFANVTLDGSPVVTDLSRNQLPALFSWLGYHAGAEIGVWEGGFSEKLVRGNPGLRRLLCVDPWESYRRYNEKKNVQARLDRAYASAQHRLKDLPCLLIRKMSVEAAQDVPDQSLDFVYIDGNHAEAYVRSDIEAWVPKVRRGGCLCGHDYDQDTHAKAKHGWIEVKAAVDAYVADHQITPLFVLARDTSPSWLWVQA